LGYKREPGGGALKVNTILFFIILEYTLFVQHEVLSWSSTHETPGSARAPHPMWSGRSGAQSWLATCPLPHGLIGTSSQPTLKWQHNVLNLTVLGCGVTPTLCDYISLKLRKVEKRQKTVKLRATLPRGRANSP
jgi:hypothetical protein